MVLRAKSHDGNSRGLGPRGEVQGACSLESDGRGRNPGSDCDQSCKLSEPQSPHLQKGTRTLPTIQAREKTPLAYSVFLLSAGSGTAQVLNELFQLSTKVWLTSGFSVA